MCADEFYVTSRYYINNANSIFVYKYESYLYIGIKFVYFAVKTYFDLN